MWLRRARLVAFVVVCGSTGLQSQPATRRATSVSALLSYPDFFHGHSVVVRGEIVERGTVLTLGSADNPAAIYVVARNGKATGAVEIRGEFWDVGRLDPEDPRLAGETLGGVIDREGHRPKPGEVFVLMTTSIVPAAPPPAPGVRAIALEPQRYVDQRVTVVGQFRGRNLYGELPQSPGVSKWDFVLRSADASVWITGVRPRGKGFDLDPAARVDTNRWLEVSGVVKAGRGLVWIEGELIGLSKPIGSDSDEGPAPEVTAGPSPEVVFSAPTPDEADVGLDTSVRIQFSRDLNAETLKGQVRVSYLAQESTERGEPGLPLLAFTTTYVGGNRVLEVRFSRSLERFRTVRIELLDGITATDGVRLKPWTLTFVLGGS